MTTQLSRNERLALRILAAGTSLYTVCIARKSNGVIKRAAAQVILPVLEQRGLVSRASDGSKNPTESRMLYTITEAGRQAIGVE